MKGFYLLIVFLGGWFTTQAQTIPLYPLVLTAPYHMDTIDDKRPTLLWQCDLASLQLDPRMDMQLKLVEKNPDQTRSDALLINEPIAFEYGLQDASFPFPASTSDLVPGHTYAWQVQILKNGMPIQQSEQWQFTIRDPRIDGGQYIRLTSALNSIIYEINGDNLYFIIEDKGMTPTETIVKKIDENGNTVFHATNLVRTNTNRDYGYYKLDISQFNLSDGLYMLEVVMNKQKYVLQFNFEK